MRWNEIKRHFTHEYIRKIENGGDRNGSRVKRREQAVCPFRYTSGVLREQHRFWEHTFYDQDDLNSHIDYIHINPLKHGLTKRVMDWPRSSFHRYVKMSVYPIDWGGEIESVLKEFQTGE